MVRHKPAGGNGAAHGGRPDGEKPVTRGTFFVVELGQLPPEQRAAVEEATNSPARTWELYRTADRAGRPAPGTDIRAVQVGGVWVVFRERADGIELAKLIPDGAFQQMGIRLTPTGEGKAAPRP